MTNEENLETTVSFLVNRRFPEAAVQAVSVIQDVDNEGQKILRVTVVFSRHFGSLSRHSMLALIGSLHNDLIEGGIRDYPLIRFVSENDATKLTREFA